MGRWTERALDLLYPRVCGLCGAAAEEGICGGCAARATWAGEDACPRCGALRDGTFCPSCAGREFRFRRAIALGPYDGALREMVLSIKFRGEVSLVRPLARRLADRVRSAGVSSDLVAFVPMSRWKILAERRHNAAETIAAALASELGVPLRRALRKIRRTRAQTELHAGERLANPAGAYRAKGVEDRAVLLVDDVLTTGATANACADALHAARAREVNVAVLARSQS